MDGEEAKFIIVRGLTPVIFTLILIDFCHVAFRFFFFNKEGCKAV